MKYTIRLLELDYDGYYLSRRENLIIVPEVPTKELFDKYFIIGKIVEAQHIKVTSEWIKESGYHYYINGDNGKSVPGEDSWEAYERYMDEYLLRNHPRGSYDDFKFSISCGSEDFMGITEIIGLTEGPYYLHGA